MNNTTAPQDAGMSADQLERAFNLLTAATEAGQIGAASLTVTRHGKEVFARGCGQQHPRTRQPVDADSIFLLASITKPVTACALMILVDRGLISLNDPAIDYLPEYTGGDRPTVKVRHLLSHISGMPDMLPENTSLRQAHTPVAGFVELALQTPLLYKPETDFCYQSMGILLAAEIVERVSGQRLRDFEREEIFAPLGMTRSALGMGEWTLEDVVWCGTDVEEDEEQQSWGWNSPYWRDFGAPWGGMHSTGRDLAILLQTMLNGGTYGDRRIFSRAAVAAMTRDQNGALNAPWGIGWSVSEARVWGFWGDLVSQQTFGHTGATGTVAWADAERQLSCVVLTNQMVAEGSLLRRVSNAVAAAVEE
ncbi:MAG: serine hydrolase [Gemmatimonadota bacterium]|nr:serine hydrolase [Gemmatimonadota bacterium]